MAITVNAGSAERDIAGLIVRERLISRARVREAKVLLDRVTLEPGATLELQIGASDLAWLQILDGEATLDRANAIDRLGDAHSVFLPAGMTGTLRARRHTTILYAHVPDAHAPNAASAAHAPGYGIVDWTREPVLDSRHDARKRIYLVTPKLFGTRGIKAEMIIYPAGTEGSNHHHEGAEHFMYVLKGRGTAFANERPIPVRKGDLIYYGDRERHYLRSDGSEELVFVEFFVPGEYRTIWAPGAPVCTWVPTGLDSRGEKPVREIREHRSGTATPHDV
jgi:mannose-6-phosphate isomerase-like protein (cupin superfamily)